MRDLTQAVNIIKEFEGLRLKAYRCPAGKWTLGYGTTFGVEEGNVITKEQAEEMLSEDVASFAKRIENLIKVKTTDNQFCSLVSLCYNIGIGNFKNSTLLKYLNNGWFEQIPSQFMRWNKIKGEEVGGLTRRRKAEVALWLSTERKEL